MFDTIMECIIATTRVFIKVSDGSILQFGINPESLKKVQAEVPLLKNAKIINFTNDRGQGYLHLDYLPAGKNLEEYLAGRETGRYLEFQYDPSEQSAYELLLKCDRERN